MLKVTTDLRAALDKGNIGILVLLDFSKAFDSVVHPILLSKLRRLYNFSSSAVRLFYSLLSDRWQCVRHNRVISTLLPVPLGVPQGSILGPLLFSLYINDLPSVIQNCSFHLYADDVQLYTSCPPDRIVSYTSVLNSTLSRIDEWCSINFLKLNPIKSQVLLLRRHSVSIDSFPILSINNVPLQVVDCVKNLGIAINTNLSCCNHVSLMLSKIYGTLRRLWLHASLLSSSIRAKLVKSLVLPHFLYGSLVYIAFDSSCRQRLKVAFNDCLRFVFHMRRSDHVSGVQNSLLGVDFFSYIDIMALCLLHKVFYVKSPCYLSDYLSPLQSLRAVKFLIPCHRSHIGSRSFFVHAIRLWNNLPFSIQRLSTAVAFRKQASLFLSSSSSSLQYS